MILEQMLKDERREGRNDGIAEGFLSLLKAKFNMVPQELREKISSTQDFDTLNLWIKIAAKADSVEEFKEKISTP